MELWVLEMMMSGGRGGDANGNGNGTRCWDEVLDHCEACMTKTLQTRLVGISDAQDTRPCKRRQREQKMLQMD